MDVCLAIQFLKASNVLCLSMAAALMVTRLLRVLIIRAVLLLTAGLLLLSCL